MIKQLQQSLLADLMVSLSRVDKNVKEGDIEIKIYENSSGVLWTLEEFFNQYNPEEIGKGQCNLVFSINLKKGTIVSFQLKDLYNCSGIMVGSDLFVSKNFRNVGLGLITTKFMSDFSSYYGYGVIQGTDRKDNTHQMKIFEKLGWSNISEFKNPKTQNTLNIWLFNLSENKNVTQNENQ